ncbi:DUF6300 family protein [Streptomyces sp. NPDC017991]|uniref:DUF6300 family protein n=1 Tax=Streptomyces sp. NPDC017991 TaxID=3365026 RepID=UPI00378AEA5F
MAVPKTDAYGRRIRLKLCKVCDTDKPAAAAFIDFFTSGGSHDLSRAAEGSRLVIEWTREGMATYGWHWEETPEATTEPVGQQPRTGRP